MYTVAPHKIRELEEQRTKEVLYSSNCLYHACLLSPLFLSCTGLTFLSGTRLLTILRVLRALRSLRSISALRGLRVVVQTVIYSLPDMANIVALLLIFMFLFAILGQSFFGDNCKRNFGSLGTSELCCSVGMGR